MNGRMVVDDEQRFGQAPSVQRRDWKKWDVIRVWSAVGPASVSTGAATSLAWRGGAGRDDAMVGLHCAMQLQLGSQEVCVCVCVCVCMCVCVCRCD